MAHLPGGRGCGLSGCTGEVSRVVRAACLVLAGDPFVSGLYRRDGDDVILTVPELATVRVSRSAPPAVELAPGRCDADVDWLLEGPVWQITRLLEGTLGLRASAVAKGGRAVVLAGGGALSGRSSLAAALTQRGFAVVGDAFVTWDPDTCTVSGDGPELMLWPDAASRLGLNAERAQEIRPGASRRRYRFPGAASATPAVVVLLGRDSLDPPEPSSLRGFEAALALRSCLALEPVISLLDLDSAALAWAAALMSRSEVIRLRSSRDAWHAVEPIEKVLAGAP